MHERKAVIASRIGLHARPAGIFAEAVGSLTIEVTIALEEESAEDAMDASSILSLMSLGAANGDIVVLRAEGAGAEEALEALVALLETDLDAE
ncbi:HPr family phosphocarrier protein [Cryobacterium tagatosivorans]|uniref:HPr family phosphocarrier protein n=1 Tax=Cryobacterium tagatosivorans TaxID=1259199 RepID=A0A4V3I6S1_9MICO|nr:HPr family phosphocarrier protein [Cryobacterium tagatosivorans]TFB54787.1 HPr family phosphocarrier protein [Cryobacterium tagatosivorans]